MEKNEKNWLFFPFKKSVVLKLFALLLLSAFISAVVLFVFKRTYSLPEESTTYLGLVFCWAIAPIVHDFARKIGFITEKDRILW
jgi:hypothetical protein